MQWLEVSGWWIEGQNGDDYYPKRELAGFLQISFNRSFIDPLCSELPAKCESRHGEQEHRDQHQIYPGHWSPSVIPARKEGGRRQPK